MAITQVDLPGVYGAVQREKTGRLQNQLMQMQMESAKADQQKQNALSSLFAKQYGGLDTSSGINWETGRQGPGQVPDEQFAGQLMSVDPGTGMKFQEHAAKMTKAQREQMEYEAPVLARLMSGVEDQESYASALNTAAARLGVDITDFPEEYDPNVVAQIQAAGREVEAFTLSPGQTRFGPDGQPVASVAPAPAKPGSTLGKLIADRDALPQDSPLRAQFDRAIEAELQGDGGPFGGTGMDAQTMNILLGGDPSSPEYLAAYNHYAQPKLTYNPSTGQSVMVTPDMSAFRPPTGSAGGGRQSLGPLGTDIVGSTPEGRPMVANPDGSYSTERSITVQAPNGRWVNIPSMFDGKQVPDDEAVSIMRENNWIDPETGRRVEFFDSLPEAEAAARARSDSIQSPDAAARGQSRGPGVTIQQVGPEPPTKAQEAVDAAFAKDYAEFVAGGGFADAQKNIRQMREAIKDIKEEGDMFGPWRGALPDWARSVTNPEAVNVKNQIEEVVQRNLRIILGAQFTENEGKRLIERAFNPSLDDETNAKRLDRLLSTMETGLEAKQAAARHYEERGTLRGYKGADLLTIRDLEEAIDGGGDGGAMDFTAMDPQELLSVDVDSLNAEQLKQLEAAMDAAGL